MGVLDNKLSMFLREFGVGRIGAQRLWNSDS